jgi:hypothetical protein
MNIALLVNKLGKLITTDQIREDLHTYLKSEETRAEWPVELENGAFITLHKNVEIDIVTVALFLEYFTIGFGALRVLAALGGVKIAENGIVVPHIAFATLYYSAEGRLITVDFHYNMR